MSKYRIIECENNSYLRGIEFEAVIIKGMASKNSKTKKPSFQKTMLEFRRDMIEFQKTMLEFVKEQRAFNIHISARLDNLVRLNNLRE